MFDKRYEIWLAISFEMWARKRYEIWLTAEKAGQLKFNFEEEAKCSSR